MPRPGLVFDVDNSSAPTLLWRGEQITEQRLPTGSRVIYAPEPVAALHTAGKLLASALAKPTGADPLASQLKPGMKLTVAFNDRNFAGLPTKATDFRQRAIEAVLDLAAAAGVDDVQVLAARGLNRRMYESELRQALGDRIYDSFTPRHLLAQHDAEDHAELSIIGETKQNETVEINKRVATSDLLIFVSVNSEPEDGGWTSIIKGLASAVTINHLYNPEQPHSSVDSVADRIGKVVHDKVKIFQIEATLNNQMFSTGTSLLQSREAEWTPRDKAMARFARLATNVAPTRFTRKAVQYLVSSQSITGVFAGSVADSHEAAAVSLAKQQTTTVSDQSDILSVGVPFTATYGANSILNPMLVAHAALGTMYNQYQGRPVVKDGGAIILQHPTTADFHPVHHPPYLDFFEQVLTDTTDAAAIKSKFEDSFAKDSWYSHMYQTSYAFHALHPFHVWYEIARTQQRIGGVIVVGGDPATVRRLGLKSASTFSDALEMASDITNQRQPSITHLHSPPTVVTAVS